MSEEESIENTLKSVKDLIKSSRQKPSSDKEILELTEDDLFDEEDEDHQDYEPNKKIVKKNSSINQILTPMVNNSSIVLEQAIAESIKPFLKDWLEETVTSIVKRELKK